MISAPAETAIVANALFQFADFAFKPSNGFFGNNKLATFIEKGVLELTDALLKIEAKTAALAGLLDGGRRISMEVCSACNGSAWEA